MQKKQIDKNFFIMLMISFTVLVMLSIFIGSI